MDETRNSRVANRTRTASLALVGAAVLSGCTLAHPELARLPPEPSQPSVVRAGGVGTTVSKKQIDDATTARNIAESEASSARNAVKNEPDKTKKDSLVVISLEKDQVLKLANTTLKNLQEAAKVESMSPDALRVSASNDILFFSVIEARRLATSYASGQREAARWQSGLQMPIIAAAAVSAGLVLGNVGRTGPSADQKTKDTLQTLGLIGIGAGTFAAARDRLLPSNLPDIYLGGYRAMICIIAEERWFLSIDAFEQQARFEAAYRAVSDQIAVTQTAIADAQTADASKNAVAIALGQARLEQASATMTAALTQMRQYMAREAVFYAAVSDTSASVVKRALVQNTDYATLRDAFYTAPAAKPSPTTGDEKKESTAEQRKPTLAEQAAQLDLLRRELERLTPNYSESLARVRQCPTLVTAAS